MQRLRVQVGGGLQRLEESRPGRVLLSVLLVFALAGAVVYNLPKSHLRGRLYSKVEPYMNAVGLDHNWGVFAPDPRRQVLGLEAKVNYPSGGYDVWRPPKRGRLIGSYSDYRWQKWFENVIGQSDQGGELPTAAALWVARTHGGSGEEMPASVSLTKRYADLPPPGSGQKRPPLAETQIFEYRLHPGDLEQGH